MFAGPISPGNHTLSAVATYRGHGYGVFEYLSKYTFTARGNQAFIAGEGKISKVDCQRLREGRPDDAAGEARGGRVQGHAGRAREAAGEGGRQAADGTAPAAAARPTPPTPPHPRRPRPQPGRSEGDARRRPPAAR